MPDPVTISVDGADVEASLGELLIEACERNGVYIPRFCHHPRMEPVGMCRMCLVDVDTGRGPSLQPSCIVPVSDNMRVTTDSDVVKKAQDGVLELLLINHPLDCPVCDKGGECPLQDQTMAYGPGESRFVEEKRHFEKPIAISDTVYLDRERCILCDRCTRFADQVAGDPLIHFMGRGGHTEVNTFPDEPFSSYFSGNTVQICPVGALTAVPYRFKARPWDLSEVVSTAWVDSVGARVSVQASRNRVLRLLGVDADAVNWGWLSDKERFSFEALNSEARLRTPLATSAGTSGAVMPRTTRSQADSVSLSPNSARADSVSLSPTSQVDSVSLSPTSSRAESGLVSTSWRTAMAQTVQALSATSPERIGVIGGARLSNESQYAWAKLTKGVLGTDNVDCQLGDGLPGELILGLPRATINDAFRPGSTVLLLGPDPKEELGSLFLRLRHAVIHDGVTVIEIHPCANGLSGLASHSLRPLPGETDSLVSDLVRVATTTPNNGLSGKAYYSCTVFEIAGVATGAIEAAGEALTEATDGVTVILGRPSLAESDRVIARAALSLMALPNVRFLSALRRGNIHGALDAGLAPGLLPGRNLLKHASKTASQVTASNALQSDVEAPADAPTTVGAEMPIDARAQVGAEMPIDARAQVGAEMPIDARARVGAEMPIDARARVGAEMPIDAQTRVGAEMPIDAQTRVDAGISIDAQTHAEGLTDVWPTLPAELGLDTHGILSAAADGEIDVLVLLGADPLNDFCDRDLADRALRGARFVMAVDLFVNDSSELAADVVLPAAAPTECDGTFTNLEGRVSPLNQKVTPPTSARPDWMIAAQIAHRLGTDLGFESAQDIRAEMSRVSEIYSPLTPEDLAAHQVEGVLLKGTSINLDDLAHLDYPDEIDLDYSDGTDSEYFNHSFYYSDDDQALRLVATRTMYDDGVLLRHCPSLRNSIRRATARVHPEELSRLGVTAGSVVCLSSSKHLRLLEREARLRRAHLKYGEHDHGEHDHSEHDVHGQQNQGQYTHGQQDDGDHDVQGQYDDGQHGHSEHDDKTRKITAEIIADSNVPPGVLAMGWLAPGSPANALIVADSPYSTVTVTPLAPTPQTVTPQ